MIENKLKELLVKCAEFEVFFKENIPAIPRTHPLTRVPGIADHAIMAILLLFPDSGMKTFKHFYVNCKSMLQRHIPWLPSYNRFIELKPRVIKLMQVFLTFQVAESEKTGMYIIDSTSLAVTKNKRIYNHKVFKELAATGKTSIGWFHGFKLHMVINHLGQIIALNITKGNESDIGQVKNLAKNLDGTIIGDKAYQSKDLFFSSLQTKP